MLPLGDSGQGCDLTAANIGAAGDQWHATYDDLLHSTCCFNRDNSPKNAHGLLYAPVYPDFNISEIQPYCCEYGRVASRFRGACFAVSLTLLRSEPPGHMPNN